MGRDRQARRAACEGWPGRMGRGNPRRRVGDHRAKGGGPDQDRHPRLAERVGMSCFRQLFTPIRIGSLELANRIVMPAIHLAYTPEGWVTDRLVDFYSERAAGGVGLIIAGGCPVDEYGGGPSMIGISRDSFVPGLTRLGEAVHREGGT